MCIKLLLTETPQRFYSEALRTPRSDIVPWRLFDLQSSALEIMWLLGATRATIAWATVGSAIRQAVTVGAHAEVHPVWNASPLEDELRRRAFHGLLFLDRTSSIIKPLGSVRSRCSSSQG